MIFELFATKVQAEALRSRDDSEVNYGRLPERAIPFAFIDQVGSSAARSSLGPKHGYMRSEAFFSLVNAAIRPYSDIRLLKEIGDEVLLVADGVQGLLESVLLIDHAASQLSGVVGTRVFPFGVRAAIGFGAVRKINRPHEDYIGSPIDRLARIMSVRSSSANILIDDEVMKDFGHVFLEYGSAISLAQPVQLSAGLSKNFPKSIFYRELAVDRDKLSTFEGGFQSWRGVGDERAT